ncbi:propionyl-CoA carboxylase, alpha subunit [Ectocarpus siliculosus]|uniref:Propionyl-CoA carboxylase, alpha subunit n=1 Tax=Ectocarpus siliculosus TaxID=2880 RepID=D7G756_ECTSI|nr:propionyl-CoA carboxylase, alpha subunit [Ectocarpus siliculosus]|eukprot:CBJ25749.1 propionyl-CoA carboxylase, alpha subunit [Ectocarpus siliculosus]
MITIARCQLRGAKFPTNARFPASRRQAWPTTRRAVAAAAAGRDFPGHDHGQPPFDKILIANRGEIACRVMATARRMGVRTVAVFSDADDQAPHVRMAGEAVCIGPPEALKSYLDADKILDAALRTGAQAIHPGYGFLSENASFAEACEQAGIAFVGPPSGAIESMGDKIESKKIAAEAGVHTIPGFKGIIESGDEAVRIAEEIGYPVMIKASAGGGGKGMRIAYDAEDARSGFERSTAEAISSFGDGRMLVEKYIEDGHHIEIQVLADSHGNVAAFPERECSVQRRNQKVLEESPSCLITPEVRAAMQEQAIMLSKATGYRSAGTVEMICASDLSFYFLEMNTRLQVEHPVTECVTDVDLVEQMLNIAAGRPMSDHLIKQPHVPFYRHAIEARVYAEDPFRKFLPSTGPLVTYREPRVTADGDGGDAEGGGGGADGVRVDSGVVEGSEVSMFYDPMISKLIAYGETREVALGRLGSALDEYVIQGLGHNVPFLRDVVRNKDFADGEYSTSFIDKHYPEGFTGVVLSGDEEVKLAAVAAAVRWVCRDVEASVGPSPDVTRPLEECMVTLGGYGGRVFKAYGGRAGVECWVSVDQGYR